MKQKLIRFFPVLLVLLFSSTLHAQTTTVSGTITDTSAQAWANGTYSFTFLPAASNPTANYFQGGVAFNKSQVINGSLDGTGSLTSVTVPDNNTILPSGSKWTVQVCPAATATNGCFRVNLTITGTTQSITSLIVPPPIQVNMQAAQFYAAYADAEIVGARVGQSYFNLTDGTVHLCTLPVCVWVSNGGGVSIANQQIAVGSGANTIAGSNNFTWNGSILFANNPTLATSLTNQNSPSFETCGQLWNGSASVSDCWQIFTDLNEVGGGSILHILHSGGTGAGEATSMWAPPILNLGVNGPQANSSVIAFYGASNGQQQLTVAPSAGTSNGWALPTANPLGNGQYLGVLAGTPNQMLFVTAFSECGTIAANGTCSNALAGNAHCVSGIATLSGGTSTITGLSPTFTSTTSYTVVTNDLTTPANSSKGVPASASSITFTGTGTDNIAFVACGG